MVRHKIKFILYYLTFHACTYHPRRYGYLTTELQVIQLRDLSYKSGSHAVSIGQSQPMQFLSIAALQQICISPEPAAIYANTSLAMAPSGLNVWLSQRRTVLSYVTGTTKSVCERAATPGFESWAPLNIKTVFPRYGDSHVKDKTVARPSYL